jgi:hypothetical protein
MLTTRKKLHQNILSLAFVFSKKIQNVFSIKINSAKAMHELFDFK